MAYSDLTPSYGELAAIRVLIPDTESVFGPTNDETMFSDDELTSYYSVAGGNVIKAAAYACVAIGSSEALIAKKITTADLSTDGEALASAFAKNAALLFARADKDYQQDVDSIFQIINYKDGWPYFPAYGPQLTEPKYPFGGDPPYFGF